MVPWWCPEIREAIKNRNHALKQFRQSRLQDDLIAYRGCRAKACCLIRSKKKRSWNKFVDSIQTSSTTSAQMWQKIKLLQGEHLLSN